MERKKTNKKGRHAKKDNKLINIILFLLICIFIYSGINVTMWLISDKKTKELETGLYVDVISEDETNSEDIEVDFSKLKEINSDVIGWIKIDNTYINYPILKGESDEYYLKKDIYKKYSLSGSIFVDSKTNPNFEDDNTVIYGHNMKNQRMFADLHKINNGELGSEIKVNIYTENGKMTYKVFSVHVEEPTVDLIKKNFSNVNEKMDYISNSFQKSNVNFNADYLNTDCKIITLMTCDNNNKRRVVVNAVKCNNI